MCIYVDLRNLAFAAANLRKFENYFLQPVGNGGIEMVAIVKIAKSANTKRVFQAFFVSCLFFF